MNWKSVILIAMVGFVASCNKFEHETFTVPDCELCDYAETLNGTYRGLSYGIAVPNYNDSITITVEQIFLCNSQYEDSTLMRFKVYYDFDSSLDTLNHIIRLDNAAGNCEAYLTSLFGPSPSDPFNSPQGYYIFRNDSLLIEYANYAGGGGSMLYFGSHLSKQ